MIAVRLLIAFVAGFGVYMVAMLMTTYDGLVSIILQPIAGAICTALGLLVVLILGLPLYWGPLKKMWWTRGWGLSLLLLAASVVALGLSWHPSLRVLVLNPETGGEIQSFHPALAIGGWLGLLFGIVHTPFLSVPFFRRIFRREQRD